LSGVVGFEIPFLDGDVFAAVAIGGVFIEAAGVAFGGAAHDLIETDIQKYAIVEKAVERWSIEQDALDKDDGIGGDDVMLSIGHAV